MGERERMEKQVSYSGGDKPWGGLAVGIPDREGLRRGMGPQLALILKVIRCHLRKWGVQPVKFIHLGRVVH